MLTEGEEEKKTNPGSLFDLIGKKIFDKQTTSIHLPNNNKSSSL
jgi:hypothetical protein